MTVKYFLDEAWVCLEEDIMNRMVSVEGFADLPLQMQQRIETKVCEIVDHFSHNAFCEGRDDERASLKQQAVNRIIKMLFDEEE